MNPQVLILRQRGTFDNLAFNGYTIFIGARFNSPVAAGLFSQTEAPPNRTVIASLNEWPGEERGAEIGRAGETNDQLNPIRVSVMKISISTILRHLIVITFISSSLTIVNAKSNSMDQSFKRLETATFAGGCFWCSESDFEKVEGVVDVISGYTGGQEKNPTYEEVSSGQTGHYEAVQVVFDPDRVTYEELLEAFWRHVNPTDAGGQFVDRGPQYRTAIFYHDEEQKRLAESSKKELQVSGRFKVPIVTEILPFSTFYNAEEYHQDYHVKSPLRYKYYRYASGRDQFVEKNWKTNSVVVTDRQTRKNLFQTRRK